MMGRSFAVNLLIGLALLLLLHTPWVQRNRAVASARDAIISWQMARLTGVDNGQKLAWIDIDEAAHAAWGTSPVTRRDKLAALIDFALRGHPAAVVADIDLTGTSGAPSYDAALQRSLRAHAIACSGASCPPVLLVRTFAPSATYGYAGRSGSALQAERSFLDPVLGTSPERPWTGHGVSWGSVGMDREPDLVVRRWRLWENSCVASGKAIVTPSLMLLAAAVATGTPLSGVRDALQPHALTCEPLSRAASLDQNESSQAPTTLKLGSGTLTLTESGLDRRLFFRIPWRRAGENTPGLAVILPAGPVAADPHADSAILRGRIVVIGTSNSSSGDLHMTPLGEMPGALVVINAMNSLLRGDEIHDVGWGATIAIEIGLIVLVSTLFATLSARFAFLISLGVIVFGALTIGFVAFNSGVWIDSVIPLGGVIAHEMIARTHHHMADTHRG